MGDRDRFLVAYDYGQGAVWAFIHARSREEIERRFPDLVVVNERPDWMSSEEVSLLEERMTFDVDKPTGWLAAFVAARRVSSRD